MRVMAVLRLTPGEEELHLGPRDGHVEEARFFRHTLVLLRLQSRERSLLQACDEDVVELRALGLMDRDDGDLLFFRHSIEVRVGERHVIEEARQSIEWAHLLLVHCARLAE